MKISVLLPRDRTRPGTLFLFSGTVEIFSADCLGKADNAQAAKNGNPTRDPVRPWGDTPTGTYHPVKVRRFEPEHATLGPYAIPLLGAGGQALEACTARPDKPARTELYVHATRTNDAGRGEDRLIPTYGCLRLEDGDMKALVEAIGDETVEIEINEMQGA